MSCRASFLKTSVIRISFRARRLAWRICTRSNWTSAPRRRPARRSCCSMDGWIGPMAAPFAGRRRSWRPGLTVPYLQVQDAEGRWRTVNKDMGMPAGKPKTIVVPVEFLSASRKVRIVTDLCVYWDEIFLSEGEADATRYTEADPAALGRSAFSRILRIAHRPAAQAAGYVLLRPCFPGSPSGIPRRAFTRDTAAWMSCCGKWTTKW